VAMTSDAARADGRRLRREQNRAAVIEALLALFRDGVYQPSTDEIAAKAGLSARSLFRYFDDVNDLHRAAADRQLQRALPLVGLGTGPAEPTADKIRAVVGSRVKLFEETGPAARALRAAATRRDMLRGILERNRSYLRHQINEVFAPELAEVGPSVEPALHVLCSFESYELLRYVQGLSRGEAEEAMIVGIGVLLGAGSAAPKAASNGQAL
jgi:AcrR family transcriptional regulator